MMTFKFIKSSSKSVFAFALLILFFACKKQSSEIVITANDYHKAVDKITAIMVHDIFSPPVASRIYLFPNVAAYEIICKDDKSYKSLVGQVNGLTALPEPKTPEQINFKVAALTAYFDLGKQLIFSEEKITVYRDSLYNSWESINEDSFKVSKEYGLEVANHIKQWMGEDNYKETRTMPKFTVNSEEPSRWQPTPPDYMDGIEPHWNKIRPMVLDSASQFKPKTHPEFSLEKGTDFYKELLEVYEVKNKIDTEGDDSEELEIARFWDCNPYVSTHKGHFMFATKKITPGAHWVGICKIACKKDNADFNKTVYAYTKLSLGLLDAFISCWDEKYRSNLIRPETLINQHLDEDWTPVLQTPPFPEYTSGHSVVSGAASVILTSVFGDNFAFEDDTELPYGLPIRSFNSFYQASKEAAVSRLYGGIHYRSAIELGLNQGLTLGHYIVEHVDMH